MRKTLLTLILCLLSFAAGTFLTGTTAAPAPPTTQTQVFEGEVKAGQVVIDQNGVNYLTLDNNDDSSALASVTLSITTSTPSTIAGIEGGETYKLLLIPGEERNRHQR